METVTTTDVTTDDFGDASARKTPSGSRVTFSSKSNLNSQLNYEHKQFNHSSLSKPVHYTTDDTREGKTCTDLSSTSIREYFANRCVFVTGGTGFLGKFLVYRLLTTCPQLNKIYVLIRGKKGKNFSERAGQYLASDLFTHLSKSPEETNALLSKVIPVEGDVTLDSLGLSQVDLGNICQEVSVVFHSAACIRFNEPLKSACKIHIEGTKSVLKLSSQIKNMSVFVHVSSISTYFAEPSVTEDIRDGPYEPDVFATLVDEMSEEQVEQMTPRLLAGYPNSYTLTKTLAEISVRDAAKSLSFPIVVSRPPFIWPSHSVPYCGYYETPQTLASLTTLFSCGIVRTNRFDPTAMAQYMPVDMVCNSLIASAWLLGSRSDSSKIKVINMSPIENPINVRDFSTVACEVGNKYPSIHQLRPPVGPIKRQHSWLEYRVRKIISHLLFAYLVDFILWLKGNKSRLVKLTNKIHEQMAVAIDAFGKQEILVEMKNLSQLADSIGDFEEREIFDFNFCHINWRSLIEEHHMQFRRFTLKEPDENLPAARARLARVTMMYTLIKMAVTCLTIWLVIQSTHLLIQALVK